MQPGRRTTSLAQGYTDSTAQRLPPPPMDERSALLEQNAYPQVRRLLDLVLGELRPEQSDEAVEEQYLTDASRKSEADPP